MRNNYDPLVWPSDQKRVDEVKFETSDPTPRDIANLNRHEPLPGADVPYFMRPMHIQGNYLITPEDGFRSLIAILDTTILIPEDDTLFNTGWFTHVIKRTPPIGEIVRFEPQTPEVALFSIEQSREILEVNGMATLMKTAPNEWQLIGGLA